MACYSGIMWYYEGAEGDRGIFRVGRKRPLVCKCPAPSASADIANQRPFAFL
jgi:hypothetical protein